MKKKNNTPVIVLLSVLIALLCMVAFMIFRMQQTVSSMAKDFNLELSENSGLESDGTVFDLYAGIYANLEKYGAAEQYEDETAQLANLMFQKTFKNCEIESVDYQEDGFILTIHGDGIPLSDFDAGLLTSAVTKAGARFLSSHFFEAAGSLIKGEDAIKEMLFTKFGGEIFDAIQEEVDQEQIQNVTYQVSVKYVDGNWKIEMLDEQAVPIGQQNGA